MSKPVTTHTDQQGVQSPAQVPSQPPVSAITESPCVLNAGNHQPPFIQPMTLDEWIQSQAPIRWLERKQAAIAQKASKE